MSMKDTEIMVTTFQEYHHWILPGEPTLSLTFAYTHSVVIPFYLTFGPTVNFYSFTAGLYAKCGQCSSKSAAHSHSLIRELRWEPIGKQRLHQPISG